MLQIDLILMSAMSQLATVIPVIAKADTMTQEETISYRQEVIDQCAKPNDYVGRSGDNMPQLKMDFFE